MAARPGRSIAFLCRPDGIVYEVLLDEVRLIPKLAPGVSFTDLVDSRSAGQAIDFLRRVQETGRVLGEKLHIAHPPNPVVFFNGVRTLSGIAVYGVTKRLRIADHGSAELLGLAAHDLRNPIAGILAASQFLLEDASGQQNDERSRVLEAIESSSLFLLQVIDDVLEFSGMRSGRVRFHFEPVDLVALINQRIVMNRSLAQRKGIRIVETKETDIPCIKADPGRVSEVIDHLLRNAIKSSPRGTVIEIRAGLHRDMATISVRDEGPGIPADQHESIFKAFWKDRRHEGERTTGLGLAIVKLIVEGHGGQIEVESQVGRGSMFTILLPIAHKEGEPKQPRRRAPLVAVKRSAAQNQ